MASISSDNLKRGSLQKNEESEDLKVVGEG